MVSTCHTHVQINEYVPLTNKSYDTDKVTIINNYSSIIHYYFSHFERFTKVKKKYILHEILSLHYTVLIIYSIITLLIISILMSAHVKSLRRENLSARISPESFSSP